MKTLANTVADRIILPMENYLEVDSHAKNICEFRQDLDVICTNARTFLQGWYIPKKIRLAIADKVVTAMWNYLAFGPTSLDDLASISKMPDFRDLFRSLDPDFLVGSKDLKRLKTVFIHFLMSSEEYLFPQFYSGREGYSQLWSE